MNSYKNIKDIIEYPAEGILSKEILKTEKFDSTLFIMAKGTDMSGHTSTREGIVYVVEGNGTFILEGEDIAMTSGVFIHMKENAVHALKAEENTAFILTLFK